MNIKNNVLNYFDRTRRDYGLIWGTRRHLSMHFGYYVPGIKKHDEAVEQMMFQMGLRAKLKPGELVLDMGCGVGGSSLWLAEKYGDTVVGVDINPASLDIAREAARKRSLMGRVIFFEADYAHVPLAASGQYDVVWFCESLCHAEDKKAVLMEAARVLKPGGRIVIADGFRGSFLEGNEELLKWQRYWAVPNIPWPPMFQVYLAYAGFNQIVWDDITDEVRPSVERLYRFAHRLMPVWVILEKLGLRTATEMENVRGAIQLYQSAKKGQCCYGIFTAVKS